MTRKRTPPVVIWKTVEAAIAHVEVDACVLWPHSVGASGYGQFQLNGQKLGVHQFVCECVHGQRPSKTHQASHSCGVRLCINPHHLRWATPKENQADRLHHGTANRGEQHYLARLTEADVLEIRSLYGRGHVTAADIAQRFNRPRSTIEAVIQKRSWAWLEPKEQF